MIGDWMGSMYSATGRRHDIRLFLDHDGRYEWKECSEPDYTSIHSGRWTADEAETVIHLLPEAIDNPSPRPKLWSKLSVTTCEESNVLLVLREVILASRNLPIIFYRVHCDGRGYGTDWQQSLLSQQPNPSSEGE
jgi:hypothetical protein